ncbi:MAG: threonine--tRNA ligase [Myxococcaceae bacterium]|nr:threonine--tRNA ligase [Myxococcaceae bacterium]MBH2006272.1 threonine--tRNA ligase [Myxococcaceae bacterium]
MHAQDTLCHSAEHVLAAAVIHLYQGAQITMGPKDHSDGFYYDIDIGRPVTPEDLEKIEAEMARIIQANTPFEKSEITKAEAYPLFEKLGQRYKKEILDWIPSDTVTLYKNDDFVDLCRGPHLDHAGQIGAFKLTGVSGSYWRADKNREMLQRVSGVAFATQAQLDEHFRRLEEAKKRDHRKLGPALELFSISDPLIGPGLVTWLPKGARIRIAIEDYLRDMHFKHGYEMVFSPHIAKSDLWKTSGHWEFYRDSMFSPMDVDGQEYVLKPMNCPFHILTYQNKPRSYRELPFRYAEFGTVYRYELAGVMHGLMRVRGFTQDDAHLFCRWDQIDEELDRVIGFVITILRKFGFSKFEVNLSTRPEKYVGELDQWDKAESSLKQAIERHHLTYQVDEGGGAFYGPKIDIKLRDCLDRLWQCSTVQLDFNNPERFHLSFVNSEGKEEQPVMIHRALLGSLERFMGILIEEHAGALPFWLAPEQIRILSIADRHLDYARKLESTLMNAGYRVKTPTNSDKLGAKIRDAQMAKVPLMLVVGDKEVEQQGANVRTRLGEDLGFKTPEQLLSLCSNQ